MEDLKFVYLICDGIGLILYALLYYCLYYTYQVNWLTSKATRIKIPRWTIIIVVASLIIPRLVQVPHQHRGQYTHLQCTMKTIQQMSLFLTSQEIRYMIRILKHLRRILRHKFWVAYYCFQLGLYRQGILHDLSKFGWYEFSRSVKFYDDNTSPLNKEKEILGYSRSYLHHRGRNPHHYEYWVTQLDSGGVPVKIPREYALELVCDYLAAGKVYNGNSFQGEYNWWIKYISAPRAIHPETKEFITQCFKNLAVGKNMKSLLTISY